MLHDVDSVYENAMLGIRGTIDLDHHKNRLELVLGSNGYLTASELLTEAAVNDGLLTEDSIARYDEYLRFSDEADRVPVSDVLLVLEHDGYLAKTPDGYRFVSGLVEDWWRSRFRMHFKPIADRPLPTDK